MSQISGGYGVAGRTDGIDYRIIGEDMQFVEIELDEGESAIAEAGAMMYKSPAVTMESIFGDGAQQGGFLGKLWKAGQRVMTGESLFITAFTQTGRDKGRVAFAAPYPGTILPFDLKQTGTIICQKDSFLAAAKGVSVSLHFQRKILTGLFGGEGFIMQRLEGDGLAFAHMGGTLQVVDLGPGEEIHVDTGCVGAMTADVDFDVIQAGSIKTMLFGGEGMFFARLRGPGRVWLQSLPFSRLAGRMLAAAPITRGGGGKGVGEGSILGGLFQGDRD